MEKFLLELLQSPLPDLSRQNIRPWENIEFKSYPGRKSVPFPAPMPLSRITLEEALQKRKTTRDFRVRSITLELLGSLLFWSAGLIESRRTPSADFKKNPEGTELRRPYPSGGDKFPIEIYVSIFEGEDIGPGIYHYNIVEHSLELLDGSSDVVRKTIPFELARKSSALLLFTLVRKRIIPQSENLSHKFGLIEAGHIGQNIYLVGTALGLGILPIGGIDYPKIEREMGLKKEGEALFHQMAIGWPLQ